MIYAEENAEVFNKWFACGKISVPSDSLYQWENISPLIFPRRQFKTVILRRVIPGTPC